MAAICHGVAQDRTCATPGCCSRPFVAKSDFAGHEVPLCPRHWPGMNPSPRLKDDDSSLPAEHLYVKICHAAVSRQVPPTK
jgi:hypothetical protein